MFVFLAASGLDTVREALAPYCRRAGMPLPTTVADGLTMAANCINAKGQTPLMHACYAGCPELVRFLLAQGADPWAADRCGCRTALHYAAISGCGGCVAALMEAPPHLLARNGVRYVNARSLSGLAPLHYAVFFERHSALRELLRHDPNIAAATTCDAYDAWADGDARATPLHFAAARGNDTAALELLRHYAARRHNRQVHDPRLDRNAGGRLPWQLAAAHFPGCRRLAMVLHPSTPLAAALGSEEELQAASLGPPSLASLAATALKQKLLSSLEAAAAAAADMTDVGCSGGGIGASGCAALSAPGLDVAAGAAEGVTDAARFRVSAALHQRAAHVEQQQQQARLEACSSTCGPRDKAGAHPFAIGAPDEPASSTPGDAGSAGHQAAAGAQSCGSGDALSCRPTTASMHRLNTANGDIAPGDAFGTGTIGSRIDAGASASTSPRSPSAAFREGQPLVSGLRPRSPVVPIPEYRRNSSLARSADGSGAAAVPVRLAISDGATAWLEGSLSAEAHREDRGNGDGGCLAGASELRSLGMGVSASEAVHADEEPAREAGKLEAECGDEESACGVCFARRESVAPATCRHGLCAECAGQLCRAVSSRPLLCPFCRQPVTAFVRAVRPDARN